MGTCVGTYFERFQVNRMKSSLPPPEINYSFFIFIFNLLLFQCFHGDDAVAYVETPVMSINSLYDWWMVSAKPYTLNPSS